MDPRKDINISGNRLVNVADPSLYHHVATKSYADALHARDPSTSEEEYIRYSTAIRYIPIKDDPRGRRGRSWDGPSVLVGR